jgi:phosphoserine phosphatase
VFANSLRFDAAGGYAGFDETAYTCRAGGKAAAVRAIKATTPGRIVMVGDGATDMEARCEGGADLFIGYGGVTVREAVRKGADWYIMSWEPLLTLLE